MTVLFATCVVQLPGSFQVPCIACEITGQDGQARGIVTATSGLALASCADHTEVTARVLGRLCNDELAGLRASFVSAGLTSEPQHDRGTGEGAVYGTLPGSGGRDRSHSVTDVLFGRLPR